MTKEYTMYDYPPAGLTTGYFLAIHLPAMVSIVASFICNVTVIALLLKHKKLRTFFQWTKSERFLVYMVICDGLFNTVHFPDHLQILITKDHVRPKELCGFYAFMVYEFIVAQVILSNIVAINAFVLVYFRIKLNFGQCDYRMLLFLYGLPAIVGSLTIISGVMGPNGSFCYFDGIKGQVSYFVFSTIPLLLIYVANVVLYFLTWCRLRHEEPTFSSGVEGSGGNGNIIRASHRAAKNMSLFVTNFFIQWSVVTIYGILMLAQITVPQFIVHMGTVFPNIGGVLNMVIYVVIQRRKQALTSASKQCDIPGTAKQPETMENTN